MAARPPALLTALTRVAQALDEAGLPWAVVGGLAVGVHGEPRVTRDVDLVLPVHDDAEAEQRVSAMQRRGFVVDSVFERTDGRLSTVRTLHPDAPRVFVDFLLSNPRIEVEIAAAALREELVPGITAPVARSWHVQAMKVLAGRKKDLVDLELLIARSTPQTIRKTEEALTLMASRGAGPGRDLLFEYRQLVDEFRHPLAPERPASASRLARLKRTQLPECPLTPALNAPRPSPAAAGR